MEGSSLRIELVRLKMKPIELKTKQFDSEWRWFDVDSKEFGDRIFLILLFGCRKIGKIVLPFIL